MKAIEHEEVEAAAVQRALACIKAADANIRGGLLVQFTLLSSFSSVIYHLFELMLA